jgi:hypothetical protein
MTKAIFDVGFDMTSDFQSLLQGQPTGSGREVDIITPDSEVALHGRQMEIDATHASGFVTSADATMNVGGAPSDWFSLDNMHADVSVVAGDYQADDYNAIAQYIFRAKDVITGSGSADVLYGYGGNDVIKGGGGHDVIVGGDGIDTMRGGAGSDTFVFDSASDSPKLHPDLITDLNPHDFIDLTAIHVQGDIVGTYDSTTNETTYRIDVDGDGRADMAIAATGDHTAPSGGHHFDMSHFLI